jgi:hypothetical protein
MIIEGKNREKPCVSRETQQKTRVFLPYTLPLSRVKPSQNGYKHLIQALGKIYRFPGIDDYLCTTMCDIMLY